jgi:hypothetical protein
MPINVVLRKMLWMSKLGGFVMISLVIEYLLILFSDHLEG